MANFNLNKVILGGRLTADPELKTTQSGVPVCSFTVAVNRRRSGEGEQQVDFINCQAWRATAEFLCRYFHKGSSVCVVGSIQTRTFTDKEGNKRSSTEVLADEIYFVDSKNENSASVAPSDYVPKTYPSTYVPEAYTANTSAQPQFELVESDDPLPF